MARNTRYGPLWECTDDEFDDLLDQVDAVRKERNLTLPELVALSGATNIGALLRGDSFNMTIHTRDKLRAFLANKPTPEAVPAGEIRRLQRAVADLTARVEALEARPSKRARPGARVVSSEQLAETLAAQEPPPPTPEYDAHGNETIASLARRTGLPVPSEK